MISVKCPACGVGTLFRGIIAVSVGERNAYQGAMFNVLVCSHSECAYYGVRDQSVSGFDVPDGCWVSPIDFGTPNRLRAFHCVESSFSGTTPPADGWETSGCVGAAEGELGL